MVPDIRSLYLSDALDLLRLGAVVTESDARPSRLRDDDNDDAALSDSTLRLSGDMLALPRRSGDLLLLLVPLLSFSIGESLMPRSNIGDILLLFPSCDASCDGETLVLLLSCNIGERLVLLVRLLACSIGERLVLLLSRSGDPTAFMGLLLLAQSDDL